jgi:hypothetical protein
MQRELAYNLSSLALMLTSDSMTINGRSDLVRDKSWASHAPIESVNYYTNQTSRWQEPDV